jgi:hypothetical protein
MAKKKAATKKVGSGSKESTLGSVDAREVLLTYATPAWESGLPYDASDYVIVGSYDSTKKTVVVSSQKYAITTFGFVVEDYNVLPGALPQCLDFQLIPNTTNPKIGSLVLKSPPTAPKLRITILTKKIPKGGLLTKTRKPKKSKSTVSKATKKK